MSSFNLRDFNDLSKRHNYFMSNYQIDGSPFLNENSIFLKKVLLNRSANSTDKILEISNNVSKPKKTVGFVEPEFISFQSPTIRKDNIPNEIFGYQIYKYNLVKSNAKKNNIQTPIKKNSKIMLNRKINRHNYNKFLINKDKDPISPVIFTKPLRFHSNTNINISDNEMFILNHKGRKIFSPNSFKGIKSFTESNSPNKKVINRIRESELYRNSLDLKKKKEEIYSRKMKKASSPLIRELLKKEKDKEIKEGKIDIEINTKNKFYTKNDEISNSKNKMRIIPINNKINNNEKTKSKNNNFITNGQNLTNNNSFIIKMKNKKKRLLNNPINENNIRRIYKMPNKNEDIRNSNETKIKEEEDSKLLNNNKTLNFKSNNIFLSKFSERTPPKNIANINNNNRIKENLELLRISKNTKDINDIKEKEGNILNNNKINSNSPIKHNSPYKFMTSNKKFYEDYAYETPILYSKDKKVSIKIHTIQNLNELFLGKKQTKEKLKMQRVNNFSFSNNNTISRSYFRNRFSKKNKENKSLRTIKEEEEKSKVEKKQRPIITEQKIEIKENPVFEKNIRRKYLRRFENKK